MQLSDYMQQTGNTVAKFAAEIGVSQEAVRMWIRGDRKPRFEQLEKIAVATDNRVLPNDFLRT